MGDLNAYIDGYCERIAPGFWGEPLNAVTNLAFIIAAAVAWRLVRGRGVPELYAPTAILHLIGPTGTITLRRNWKLYALTAILFLIGVGSFLFHTFATGWAAAADVLPILAFVLLYLYSANRHLLGMRRIWALACTALFFVYAPLATIAVVAVIPPIGGSAGYGAIALLIFGYGIGLWRRRPDVAPGLLIGALVLSVSITFRALDEPLCDVNPYGTHTAWHILNGVMLAWMIVVMRDGIANSKDRARPHEGGTE